MDLKVSNHILIDHDMLFDLDLGIRQLILDNYKNNDVFKIDLLEALDKKSLVGLFKYRLDPNPLSVMIRDDYKSNSDDLYKQMMESELENILKLSPITNLYRMIQGNSFSNSISFTILCKNLLEQQNSKRINVNTILLNDNERLDISEYDTIYIKSFDVCKLFKTVKAKNIYIADYEFNNIQNIMDAKNIPLLELIMFLSKVNELTYVELYSLHNIIKPIG